MPTTDINALPYPALATPAAPDIPADMQALAEALDTRVVPSFADATARDAAITSPTDGMLCYLQDVDYYTARINGSWVSLASAAKATGTGSGDLAAGNHTHVTPTTQWSALSTVSYSFGSGHPSSSTRTAAPVAVNGSTIIAGLGTTSGLKSTDSGVTWAVTGNFPATTSYWGGLSYGAGLFIACQRDTSYGNVASTPNGTTWTARAMPATQYWQCTAWNGSVFVAVGRSSSGTGTTQAASSTDGQTWTSRTMATSGRWDWVVWDGTKFVAFDSQSAAVNVSTNGVTWSADTSSGPAPNGAASDGAGTVVVVAGSSYYYSTDHGHTWSSGDAVSIAPNGGVDVFHADGAFYFVPYATGSAIWSSLVGVLAVADLGKQPVPLTSPRPTGASTTAQGGVAWVATVGSDAVAAGVGTFYR